MNLVPQNTHGCAQITSEHPQFTTNTLRFSDQTTYGFLQCRDGGDPPISLKSSELPNADVTTKPALRVLLYIKILPEYIKYTATKNTKLFIILIFFFLLIHFKWPITLSQKTFILKKNFYTEAYMTLD